MTNIYDERHFELTVNGERRKVVDVYPGESLLSVLRDRLGLTGAKGACEEGECGSCSVLLDGNLVCSCPPIETFMEDEDEAQAVL